MNPIVDDAGAMRHAMEKLNRNRLSRMLAPLVHRGAALVEAEDGFRYAGAGAGRLGAAVTGADVANLLAQDLIERTPSGYRISAAGRSWLKRMLAPGDAFQAQHAARRPELRAVEGEEERPVIVNDAESPLAWLARRKDKTGAPMITPQQFAAGERLRSDYTYAALGPRMTASYSAMPGRRGGGEDAAHVSDTVLAARQRVSRALAAVGPELAGVLVDVCCHLKGLEEAEREEGWPQRSGKVVLQIALTGLARHYGLLGVAQGQGGRRMVHWGARDYRPGVGDAAARDTAEGG